MKRSKIVLVDYFNTLPFLSALKSGNFQDVDIVPAIPAQCSEMFFGGDADIALVPAASWILNGSAERVITDYCIGCEGEVATVLLHTNDALEDINTIFLDTHSRTSAMLLRILCRQSWKIFPDFVSADVSSLKLEAGQAKLMIGDKVFTDEQSYKFTYDLGLEWKKMTGLPFAFAIWIAKDHVSTNIIDRLNEAFSESFDNIDQLINQCEKDYPTIDLKTYFSTHISYPLERNKKKALQEFENQIKSIVMVKS